MNFECVLHSITLESLISRLTSLLMPTAWPYDAPLESEKNKRRVKRTQEKRVKLWRYPQRIDSVYHHRDNDDPFCSCGCNMSSATAAGNAGQVIPSANNFESVVETSINRLSRREWQQSYCRSSNHHSEWKDCEDDGTDDSFTCIDHERPTVYHYPWSKIIN